MRKVYIIQVLIYLLMVFKVDVEVYPIFTDAILETVENSILVGRTDKNCGSLVYLLFTYLYVVFFLVVCLNFCFKYITSN